MLLTFELKEIESTARQMELGCIWQGKRQNNVSRTCKKLKKMH
jgi:hypothetical protein